MLAPVGTCVWGAPPSVCGGSAVDQAQLLKSKKPYGIASMTSVYNSAGRPIRLSQVALPDGAVRNYTFDFDSNRTSIIENGTTTSSYTYDPSTTPGLDQLTSVTSGGGTITSGYDADGEMTTRASDTIGWDGRSRHNGGTFAGTTISYGFDAAGFRRQRIVDWLSSCSYRCSDSLRRCIFR
jgi:YD repeat-containing protein